MYVQNIKNNGGFVMDFEVVQSDITQMLVDAIVLPANEKLKEGSGTSRAIFEKAGRKELTRACAEIRTCKMGEAVPTLAFKLDANYIIHAVVPKWIDGEHQEYDYLSAAYLSALNVADIMNCETIAFPLLASGNNRFDLGVAYEVAKTSIESFAGINLKKVFLVIYSDNVATFLKGKGVTIINLKGIQSNKKKEVQKDRKNLCQKEGKNIAEKFLKEQIAKGLNYINDEKNREKVIKTGIEILKMVVINMKKKK